jgi:SWI/SNF-related matrix-associated actin-dependent regulator of chromatin subfamily A-like protein 1
MKPKLYQFQEESLPPLMARRHNLLALEMGLGKTLIAVELINRLRILDFDDVLIICKASIKENWRRKVIEYLDAGISICPQIVNRRIDVINQNANIIIVNYDLLTHSYIFQQLKKRKFGLLICDEAHYLKNMETKRTKAVLAKNGLVFNCDRSLMMTGTPVLNRPFELYPMLKVLAPKVIAPYTDMWSYAKRYCDAWHDGFGLNTDGASHTDELNKKLREHYMIRRTWNDVEIQLPKRRYEMIFIDPTAKAREALTVIEKAQRRDFKRQQLDTDAGGLATLRRETAEEKISVCLEQIKEYIESSGKLVIFAYHHSVIERLKNELKEFGVVTLDGATSQIERQRSIDNFCRLPQIRLFIGQLQAAGEGIDGLQTACHHILFIETSWVPAEISQAIARLWRLGQNRSVLVRFLIWANSIEEHMMRVALDKVETIREIVK